MADRNSLSQEHANTVLEPYTDWESESLSEKSSDNSKHLTRSVTDRSRELSDCIMKGGKAEAVLSAQYVVKGWLSAGGLSCLYGPSNVGKTFVVVDLGGAVSMGREWAGYRVAKGAVVYVAAEGGSGIINRLAAYRKQEPDFEGAEFYCLRAPLDLHGEIDPTAISYAIKALQPSLVVIDTLARCMGDGDENSTKDMCQFVKGCDQIRALTGAHVMVVHHSGKDESRGARGSYSLFAAVDTEIHVTKEKEIHCTKVRDFVTPEKLKFCLRSVRLGDDDDGDEVSSATVELHRISEAPSKNRAPLKGQQLIAWQALDAAMVAHGKTYTGNSQYPANTKIVELSYWREECDRRGLTEGKSNSAARTAFGRVVNGLQDKHRIQVLDGMVWRCFDGENEIVRKSFDW